MSTTGSLLIANRRQETLRHCLAHTVGKGTAIGCPAGVEHTKWVEPETFRRIITFFTSDKAESVRVASQHVDTRERYSSGQTAYAWRQVRQRRL